MSALFRNRFSPHQLGVADVLATLILTDETPVSIILIGVVPSDLELGLDLLKLLGFGLGLGLGLRTILSHGQGKRAGDKDCGKLLHTTSLKRVLVFSSPLFYSAVE